MPRGRKLNIDVKVYTALGGVEIDGYKIRYNDHSQDWSLIDPESHQAVTKSKTLEGLESNLAAYKKKLRKFKRVEVMIASERSDPYLCEIVSRPGQSTYSIMKGSEGDKRRDTIRNETHSAFKVRILVPTESLKELLADLKFAEAGYRRSRAKIIQAILAEGKEWEPTEDQPVTVGS